MSDDLAGKRQELTSMQLFNICFLMVHLFLIQILTITLKDHILYILLWLLHNP